MTEVTGWVCGPRIYRYKGWLFEWPAGTGCPWPIKIDGEPYKRAGRVFWGICSEFARLPDEEKKRHRVGGGCRPI